MGIQFNKKAYDGVVEVFWREERKVLPNGFAIKQEFADGTVIPKGTFGQILTGDSNKFAVCKVAEVVTGGTTTKIRVKKGSLFQTGDVVMKVGKDDVSPTISSIDKSNADYDVITVGSAITGVTAGDVLQECTEYAAGQGGGAATPAAAKYIPNAVVEADLIVDSTKGVTCIDLAHEAFVLKSRVVTSADWFNTGSFCLKLNPNIKVLF